MFCVKWEVQSIVVKTETTNNNFRFKPDIKITVELMKIQLKYFVWTLKDLCYANACWLVLIYNTLIITYVAKRIFKCVQYIL